MTDTAGKVSSVQAVVYKPLPVYGASMQLTGYLPL